MDTADRIPESLDGFTAAEAVEALRRRQPVAVGPLLTELRRARIDQRATFHLEQIDILNAKAAAHHGAPWLRAQDNITRHLAALDYLQGITP